MPQLNLEQMKSLVAVTIADSDRISKLKQTGEPLLFPAYMGVKLTQLVDLHGIDMMAAIIEVDPTAARLTAADMVGALGVNEPNQNPLVVASMYLQNQNQAQLGVIDGANAVNHDHQVGREALLKTVAIFDGAEYDRKNLHLIHRPATQFLRSFEVALSQVGVAELAQVSVSGPSH